MTKAMMAEPAATRAVARPLRVLVPLIKEDLESAATAGLPYYIAAGEKLLEAKTSGQVSDGSWGRWLNSNFHLKRTQAFRYMKWRHRPVRPVSRVFLTKEQALGTSPANGNNRGNVARANGACDRPSLT